MAGAERRHDDAQGGLQVDEDVGDGGFVEGRERKAYRAEVVEGCAASPCVWRCRAPF